MTKLVPSTDFLNEARWYVVYSHPRKEPIASINLERQGFRVFMPRMMRTTRHARRTRQELRPMFPRYLFVSLSLAVQRWRPILGTSGVSGLVMDGDRPRPLPHGIVEELILTSEGCGGNELFKCTVGTPVHFLSGPFADKIGRLAGMKDAERVGVLLEILGAEREVVVKASQLRPVGV